MPPITSWTEQLRALGFTPRTAHREIQEIPAPKHVAHLLGLDEAEHLFMLRRVRLTNEEPVSLMTNYLPCRLVPGFEDISLLGNPSMRRSTRDTA